MSPSCKSHTEMRMADLLSDCKDVEIADHDCWQRCLSDLALLDLASKARLLQSLSSYLSCVAATMAASIEDYSLSACVGNLKVRLQNVEVMKLHNLLVRELENQTDFLSRPHAASINHSGSDGNKEDEILLRTLHLEVVSETLRCCIRILPLVDCFDTSLSFGGAALLDALMQQLCSPTRLYDMLSRLANHSSCSVQQKSITHISWRTADARKNRNEISSSKEYFSAFAPLCSSVETKNSIFQSSRETRQRIDVFFAILEVYMDELLLCPDLGARFLSFQDDTRLCYKEERLMSSVARHTEASVEAAFVHALLSCLSKVPALGSKLHTSGNELLVCNLSLPAGLLLLETLAAEHIPTLYLTHIIQLVARVLVSSTPQDLDAGLASSIGPAHRSFFSGGVDWSYCVKKVSTRRDPLDWILRSKKLPTVTTIHFASSIFEQAVQLYMKFSSSNLDTDEERGCQNLLPIAHSPIVGFCLRKYRPLLDILRDKPEIEPAELHQRIEGFASQLLEFDRYESPGAITTCRNLYLEVVKRCVCSDSKVEQIGKCESTNNSFEQKDKGDAEGESSLMSAVLDLMVSSLECIVKEIAKMPQLSPNVPLNFVNGQPGSTATSIEDSDRILEYVSLYVSSFLPTDSRSNPKYPDRLADQEMEDHLAQGIYSPGERSLISSAGKAILFFTNVFCDEVKRGAPRGLTEDHFHLLESLVALLLVVEGRKRVAPLSEAHLINSHGPVLSSEMKVAHHNFNSEQLQRGKGSFFWLGAMVRLLQDMLQDLSTHQRPLPELFLDFVLDQISKGDGLNLVALAFSGSLEHCTKLQNNDGHVTLNIKLFESNGLANQILQLALLKPTIPSSFSTLVGYITTVLEDLLPIRATQSLQEVGMSLSRYEHIALSFTLACQFAVSEQVIINRNGQQNSSLLLSKMFEGIERLLSEGTAVAEWISNWTISKSIPSCSSDTEMRNTPGTCSRGAQNTPPAASSEGWHLENCNKFLIQVDTLRSAVSTLRKATDWVLIPDTQYSSLFTKAKVFLDAFSKVMMKVDTQSTCPWSLHVLLHRKQILHEDSFRSLLQTLKSFDSANEGLWMGTDRGGCQVGRRSLMSDKNLPATDMPSSNASESEQREKLHQEADHDESPEDRSTNSNTDPNSTRRVPNKRESAASEKQEHQGCDASQENSSRKLAADSTSVVEAPLANEATTLVDNNVLHACVSRNVQPDVAGDRGEIPFIGLTGEGIISKVVVVSKRVTRSETLSISQKDGPSDPGRKKICSPTTLTIVKRLMQRQHPLSKRLKRDNRGYTERCREVLDLTSLQTREEKSSSHEFSQQEPMNDSGKRDSMGLTGILNPYINTLLGKDRSEETFEDLNDFIVCKKGRDYSKWLNERQKVRRRLHTRNLFKRLQEKKDLLLLLDICE